MQRNTITKVTVGERYLTKSWGWLIVLEYRSAIDLTVKFEQTGTIITKARSDHIRNGSIVDPMFPTIANIGFRGIGKYSRTIHEFTYTRWINMIKRVYSPQSEEVAKTYFGCSVVEEWHNFQNFAEWVYTQDNPEDTSYQIDKDLKVEDNKIYGPDYCLLIPQELNHAISPRSGSDLGPGVTSNRYGRYASKHQIGNHRLHLGTFDTIEEANEAYRLARSVRIIEFGEHLYSTGRINEYILGIIKSRKW